MKLLKLSFLYIALAFSANPLLADAELEALREGDMKKLIFHSAPKAVSQQSYEKSDGTMGQLSDYKGQYIVLNFWATWCAPCRIEMPMLSDLQTALGSDQFSVVTLATGRNPRPFMEQFFAEIGVDNLPLHKDHPQALAREMGVFGLPVTLILNPDGQEIARLQGHADWSSDSAKAIITTLLERADQS